MSLYNSFAKDQHLGELATPIDDRGTLLTPTVRRNRVMQNVTGDSNILAADLAILAGLAAELGAPVASGVVALDSSSNLVLPSDLNPRSATAYMTKGSGITSATGAIMTASVHKIGGIFYTRIFIDLTGCASETTLLDIIGDDGAANCHFGQITTAVNGVIFKGKVTCLELPATGELDIDFYSATVGTGVEGAGVAALDETALLAAGGDWSVNETQVLTLLPPADDFLYLVTGDTAGVGVYTAGQFLLEFEGI